MGRRVHNHAHLERAVVFIGSFSGSMIAGRREHLLIGMPSELESSLAYDVFISCGNDGFLQTAKPSADVLFE